MVLLKRREHLYKMREQKHVQVDLIKLHTRLGIAPHSKDAVFVLYITTKRTMHIYIKIL